MLQTSRVPQQLSIKGIGLISSIGIVDRIFPCKAIVQQIAKFFLYHRKELKLLVLVVKGYRVVLDHVFSRAGFDLAANHIICRML